MRALLATVLLLTSTTAQADIMSHSCAAAMPAWRDYATGARVEGNITGAEVAAFVFGYISRVFDRSEQVFDDDKARERISTETERLCAINPEASFAWIVTNVIGDIEAEVLGARGALGFQITKNEERSIGVEFFYEIVNRTEKEMRSVVMDCSIFDKEERGLGSESVIKLKVPPKQRIAGSFFAPKGAAYAECRDVN